jgi:glycosyltransferase involved in cell wall biosynthesis
MTSVLVLDPWLAGQSGTGAVCMNVLEALEDHHDVTLITVGRPDLDELNRYYGTSVTDVTVESTLLGHVVYYFPRRLQRLRAALFNNLLGPRIGSGHDLVVTMYNELAIPQDCLNYVHDPSSLEIASGPDDRETTTYVANSAWTANQAMATLERRPRVINPPVRTTDIEPVPWEERADRIVSIGRVAPEKGVLRNIRIVRRLREGGHDVDYHVLGPFHSHLSLPFSATYAERVADAARTLEFVHLEGAVTRERLTELVATSKYGLHGMEGEHFGIGVAELVAGGTVPFVPRDGGARRIVGDCEDVLYDSSTEAIEAMDRLVGNDERAERIRRTFPDVATRYGRGRFHREFRDLVGTIVSGSE